MPNTITIDHIPTPLGNMTAGATTHGICLLEFTHEERLKIQRKRLEKQFQIPLVKGTDPLFSQLQTELQEYFAGSRKNFTIPLDIEGTPFQKAAWKQLLSIPYGQTISYQEQARGLGNAKASRAVAGANNANKIALLVPCHRVIGKNGTMTGYAGEIWRKKYLLNLENPSTHRQSQGNATSEHDIKAISKN